MTQRVARPMKFAAFISIILSVAVLFAACQGAVGPKGDKGDQGPPGDSPEPIKGDQGDTPLYLTGDTEKIPVFINDDDDGAGDAVMVTVTDHFAGGIGDITIGDLLVDSTIAATNRIFTASMTDGVITFGVRLNDSDEPAVAADAGYVTNDYTVKVADSLGPDRTLTFEVRRNRAPTAPTTPPDNRRVGTQAPEKAPDSTPACPAANECYLDIVFEDLDAADRLSFTAVSADSAKVEVVSYGNAVDDNGDIQAKTARVVLKGVASTWVADNMPDTDGDQPGHDEVELTVTAKDPGGLEVEYKPTIAVDGAPTVTTVPNGTVKSGTTYNIVSVAGFFDDPENETLTYTAEVTKGTNFVTASIESGGGNFTVTYNAPGAAEVTITASEGDAATDAPQQNVKAVVSITSS